MNVDPVLAVPISDTANLRRAVRDVLARGNPVVPAPRPGQHPEPVMPRHAGVKTYAAFARGTSSWSIKGKDGAYQIVGKRSRPDRGWEDDPGQTVTLPSGANVDDVCDRLIAILQAAAGR
jgi:hypothetical protein